MLLIYLVNINWLIRNLTRVNSIKALNISGVFVDKDEMFYHYVYREPFNLDVNKSDISGYTRHLDIWLIKVTFQVIQGMGSTSYCVKSTVKCCMASIITLDARQIDILMCLGEKYGSCFFCHCFLTFFLFFLPFEL